MGQDIFNKNSLTFKMLVTLDFLWKTEKAATYPKLRSSILHFRDLR